MEKIKKVSITFGCDPEFFFTKDGKVVGAEKVLPEEGLKYHTDPQKHGTTHVGYNTGGKVIIDGVQAELNPRANTCRANLANELSACFTELDKLMEQNEIEASFIPCIEIDDTTISGLSEKSKQFGCSPSKNVNGKSKMAIKDASKYNYRPAGGHIHLGSSSKSTFAVLKDAKKLIPILDIIVGNTCVLIDRDKGNIERRKVYGRASEYRTPEHGIEYRTLSNFWLRAYPLMGLVMGLARQAVAIVESGYAKDFLELVDHKDVVKAINENDFELAQKNFNAILPFLLEITPDNSYGHYPIDKTTIVQFNHFVNKGIDYWFNHDVVKHWKNLPEGHDTGFETFLSTVVKEDIKK